MAQSYNKNALNMLTKKTLRIEGGWLQSKYPAPTKPDDFLYYLHLEQICVSHQHKWFCRVSPKRLFFAEQTISSIMRIANG